MFHTCVVITQFRFRFKMTSSQLYSYKKNCKYQSIHTIQSSTIWYICYKHESHRHDLRVKNFTLKHVTEIKMKKSNTLKVTYLSKHQKPHLMLTNHNSMFQHKIYKAIHKYFFFLSSSSRCSILPWRWSIMYQVEWALRPHAWPNGIVAARNSTSLPWQSLWSGR